MIANLFEIRKTKKIGSGLYAVKFIPKGTIICFECEKCKKRSKEELDQLSEEELDWVLDHEYIDKSGLRSNVCDKTILYLNHSCNANILYSDYGFDIVVRDIEEGEEATYDYRVYHQGDEVIACKCGEKNCCGTVRYIHPVPIKLQKFWDKKVDSALEVVNEVEQPLKKALLRNGINIEDL